VHLKRHISKRWHEAAQLVGTSPRRVEGDIDYLAHLVGDRFFAQDP